MTIQELRHILLELCKLESENEIVEFRRKPNLAMTSLNWASIFLL